MATTSGNICMFAGPEDDAQFCAYARSIGLTLLPSQAHTMLPDERKKALADPRYGGLFSFLPLEQLHPHPSLGLCEAIDPLIPYTRCTYEPPYLVASNVQWYSTARDLALRTKPYFVKLRRWVQTNWKRREGDGYYIGPQAERILREEHARIAYLPPDVAVETRIVAD